MPTSSSRTQIAVRHGVRAARLFDGTRFHTEVPSLVVIENAHIIGLDTSGSEPPTDLPLHDLGDATLLPGLIDAHTHLVLDATAQSATHVQTATSEQLVQHMRSVARSMLGCGITTARDLGDRHYLSLGVRDETAATFDAGPSLLVAGPPLTSVKGHCWFLGGEVDGVEGIVASIRDHAERGVDVIKVMTTGGRLTPTTLPHESQFTLSELRAAADTAHDLDLRIAGHAHGRQGILDSLRAGFDTLEHVSFMVADGVAPDQAIIDEIADSGVIASMTAGGVPGAPLPPEMVAALPALFAHFENLHASGVRITLGPDGGIGPPKPHTVLPYAIEQVVQAGFSISETLSASTVTAAEALGLADFAGRIAAGYDADLLAVAGDLSTDVSAVHRPVAIYRHGMLVGGH